MAEITIEKTHALLEKLAEYVMTSVATKDEVNELRREMDQRFEQVDKRFEQVDKRFEQVDKRFEQVDKRFEQVDKRFEQVDKRFEQVDKRFEQIDERFEQIDRNIVGIHSQLDLIRIEQRVFSQTFDLHQKRLSLLEDDASAYRIKDKK